ncbi:MAG: hypothetical protein MR437_04455 [Clostridiales bacterium]|nr:hypothetical protein [Clostridiales bacterium]
MLVNLLYLDPAATTAIITSLTAIIAAVGAWFIIRWRKIKKGVSKTLHIDENAKKEVEDDLVITDADIAADEQAEKVADEQAEKADEDVAATETEEKK